MLWVEERSVAGWRGGCRAPSSHNVPRFAANREEAHDEEEKGGVETGSGSTGADGVARLHRTAAPPCARFLSNRTDNRLLCCCCRLSR